MFLMSNIQRGVILVITLSILAIVTLITVSALNQSGNQLKMVSQAQQYQQTFIAAESALSHTITMLNTAGTIEYNSFELLSHTTQHQHIELENTLLSDEQLAVSVVLSVSLTHSLKSGISLNMHNNDTRELSFSATAIARMKSSGLTTKITVGLSVH